MRRDNRGFTLIELIVTVAIIAIFSGVVMNFITTGSNTYRNTSKTTRVQMDAQAVLDEIQDLVIDVNRGVYYAAGTEKNIGASLDNDIEKQMTGSRVLFFCSEDPHQDGQNSTYILDVLEWNEADQKIYYTQYKKQGKTSSLPAATDAPAPDDEPLTPLSLSTPDMPAAFALSSPQDGSPNSIQDIISRIKFGDSDITKTQTVLAEGITGFHADTTRIKSSRTVRFQIMVNNGGKDVATLHTVNMRNMVQVVPMGDVFADSGEADTAGIAIQSSLSSVAANKTFTLLCTYKNIYEETIKWEVEENGTFVKSEGISAKFTAGENDFIKVRVLAKPLNGCTPTKPQTINGETWVVDEKIIQIIPNVQVTELTPSVNSILVAAGHKMDLKNAVTWTEGEEHLDGTDLIWSVSGNVLANEWLEVSPDAMSAMEVTVRKKGENQGGVEGKFTVNIARIELDELNSMYSIGDAKPILGYTYKINGENVPNNEANLRVNKQSTNSGDEDWNRNNGLFAADDKGDWVVNVTYDLKLNRNEYGTVSDEKRFGVAGELKEAIIVIGNNDKNNVVLANEIYDQKYYINRGNTWGIDIKFPTDPTDPNRIVGPCKIKWDLITPEGTENDGITDFNKLTRFDNGEKSITLTPGKNEQTTLNVGMSNKFKLNVYAEEYHQNDNQFKTIIRTFRGSKDINVLYDAKIKIISLDEQNEETYIDNEETTFSFTKDKKYKLELVLYIGDYEKSFGLNNYPDSTSENHSWEDWLKYWVDSLPNYGDINVKEGIYTPTKLVSDENGRIGLRLDIIGEHIFPNSTFSLNKYFKFEITE